MGLPGRICLHGPFRVRHRKLSNGQKSKNKKPLQEKGKTKKKKKKKAQPENAKGVWNLHETSLPRMVAVENPWRLE